MRLGHRDRQCEKHQMGAEKVTMCEALISRLRDAPICDKVTMDEGQQVLTHYDVISIDLSPAERALLINVLQAFALR